MEQASNIRNTWLWRHAFINPQPDISSLEQEYFSNSLMKMREKASMLVSQISSAIPGLTVHDITHLDALWEMASLISEGAITVSPAEAFVFGASVLLHDSAMSLSAYPEGLESLKKTIEWKDVVATLLIQEESEFSQELIDSPPKHISEIALPEVLRLLHAKQAENLATQGWLTANHETIYLIDDSELRHFYGQSIGKIAHSHWWSISKVQDELTQDLGAFPGKTKNRIDRLKIACLLRLSDAIHIDQRRAPLFLEALIKPQDISALHWEFQRKMASPHIEKEEIVFTSSSHFGISEVSSWWLAYDTISAINKEFIGVDSLFQSTNKPYFFRARKVKNAHSPESLSKTILTEGWKPVDTTLKISDIPKVIENLGGSKLYGDNPTIALRELLQNSSDSIHARRKYQNRPTTWGEINVKITEKEDGFWLSVEDNGIGMSENVLTGPLIDFGTSFWKTPLARSEFPGLASKGLVPTGKFGIGFFSVFMLSDNIKVISKRFDKSNEDARMLEFNDGIASRPLISKPSSDNIPVDGGTRVELLLKKKPNSEGGLLFSNPSRKGYLHNPISLKELIRNIAPSINASVNIEINGNFERIISIDDWLTIEPDEFIQRIALSEKSHASKYHNNIRKIIDKNGKILGRAAICPKKYGYENLGKVTVGGLYSDEASNIIGILAGNVVTASRNTAIPLISADILTAWANEQRELIQNSNLDNRSKSDCAEIILGCNSNIGALPIVQQTPSNWFNIQEFRDYLKTTDEIILLDRSDLSFESEDYVTPRDFDDYFEVNDGIFLLGTPNSEIINNSNITWPSMLFKEEIEDDEKISDAISTNKKIHNLLVRTIFEEWKGDNFLADSDSFIEIGNCQGISITRNVIKFNK